MRKYLFNGGIISAIFSGIGIIKATISGPRDWRLIAAWAGWVVSLVIAIGAATSPEDESESPKKRRR